MNSATDERGIVLERMLHWERLWADGMPLNDIQRAARDISHRDQWLGFWADTADNYETLGSEALETGATISAGNWLWLASLSCHYGQFRWFHEIAPKEALQRRKVDLFNRAAPLFKAPARRFDRELDGYAIPGFVRLPAEPPPQRGWPVVLLVGGLESTKEESHLFENLLLERGLAIVAFDGPGQGELFFQVRLQPDFERYASAVLDYVVELDHVDSDRIAVLGRSLGGSYALRCAAQDERIRACVSWGGSWSEEAWEELPEGELLAWLYVSGFTDDPKAGVAYLRTALDLSDVASELGVPTLAVLGERGDTGGAHHLDAHLHEFPRTKVELMVLRDCAHCCHDLSHVIRPRMADWIVRQLGTNSEVVPA